MNFVVEISIGKPDDYCLRAEIFKCACTFNPPFLTPFHLTFPPLLLSIL